LLAAAGWDFQSRSSTNVALYALQHSAHPLQVLGDLFRDLLQHLTSSVGVKSTLLLSFLTLTVWRRRSLFRRAARLIAIYSAQAAATASLEVVCVL